MAEPVLMQNIEHDVCPDGWDPEVYEVDDELVKRINSDNIINRYGKDLLNFCKETGVRIVNGRINSPASGFFTFVSHQGKSVVDYLLTKQNVFHYLSHVEIYQRIESDHLPIVFNLCLYDRINNACPQITSGDGDHSDVYEHDKPLKRFIWNTNCLDLFINRWKHPDITSMTNSFMNVLRKLHIDQAVTILCDIFAFVGKSMHRPYTSHRSTVLSLNTWFDEECLHLKNLVQRKLSRFRFSYSNDALDEYKILKQQYKELLKTKKRLFMNKQQQSLLASLYDNDAKSFWSQLKSPSQTISDHISIDQWFDHFKCLLNPDVPDGDKPVRENASQILHETNDSDRPIDWSPFLNADVTEAEVIEAINALKLGKATGIDGFPAEFVKFSPKSLIDLLVKLFNAILTAGCFPFQWATGLIVPLFKKGSHDDPGNYRGISLISVMCKVFSGVLLNRLNFWADATDFFCQEQAGFRKGFRTTDNVFVLYTLINRYLSRKKGRVYVAFVDFRKAFDSVNHQFLISKLRDAGITGNILDVLQSMYLQLNAHVKTPVGVTKSFPCASGVQQGSLLSPFLFNLFLNNLSHKLNSVNIQEIKIGECYISHLLYADDLALISDTVFGLQRQLNILADYCSDWGLSVNIDKTKIMVFRRGGQLKRIEKWNYMANPVEVVSFF
jgi:hypothetical protein